MKNVNISELYRLATLYHAGTPEVSDAVYDDMVKAWIHNGGDANLLPLDGGATNFPKGQHLTLMGSLDNAFGVFEYDEFCKRTAKKLGVFEQDLEFWMDPKADGSSLELLYENGILIRALTRGNGFIGDVVTSNALCIRGVPGELPKIPETQGFLEIRGEVVMYKDHFLAWNATEGGRYANSRNAVAGSLRLGNPEEVKRRPLLFIAHSTGIMPTSLSEKPTWENIIECMSIMGFQVQSGVIGNSAIEYLETALNNTDYDIDGIVVKINKTKDRLFLGMGTRTPYWATAVKRREGDTAQTIIKEITIQVGRTGALTPVAELEPISVGQVIVSRATLHNQDEIDRLGLCIGDLVAVRRAGEVIPEIINVVQRYGNEVYTIPNTCPSCGCFVTRNDEEAVVYCQNSNCPERKIQQFIHFVGVNGLDIKGLGESLIRKFVDMKPEISDPSEILNSTVEDFMSIPRVSEKMALKIWNSIRQAIRTATLPMVIQALGIRFVGEGTAKRLAKNFPSIKDFAQGTLDDFMKIKDIGETTAMSLDQYLKNPKNQIVLQKIQDFGLNPTIIQKTPGQLSGKTILFTGTLSMSRKEAERIAEEAGATIASSVSKNLSILVVGDNAGGKLDKAKKLGITTIDEKEFKNIFI